jgi:predicted nucleotidyltransferase
MRLDHPTPYAELNEVLSILVKSIEDALADVLIGVYLQGSFAIGEFDEHSDVDFIVVIQHDLSGDQLLALQAVHEQVYNLETGWAKHLEGSYFPREILARIDGRGEPLWYLDHGSKQLVRSDHCNTLVVRSVIRTHGITLVGPHPATLVDSIPVSALRAEILATIRDWGDEILHNPDQFNNRFYQGFIVLNYCRMLHDLHTGVVGSKRAGAVWAKSVLDAGWRQLIDRAWDCRVDPATSVRQRPDPDDFRSTLAFVQYSIEYAMDEAKALR